MNRRMEVLQTSALPLGYAAKFVERETGFEPATSTLARLHSTTELFPLTKSEAVFTFAAFICQQLFLFFFKNIFRKVIVKMDFYLCHESKLIANKIFH